MIRENAKPCLHCALNAAIDDWIEKNAVEENGRPVFNVGDIISALVEVAGEYCEAPSDRSQRSRALKFAHLCLEASVQAVRTGKSVQVSMPTEH